ncbi:hypothetical protein POM88_033266 [Heracleum sosnowskyi]|uniref:Late embryogenesis abundant protein LEA-2 subgroup domain-containing protein n=1 Tax=Heracleum sosnowskyi TaxID=360622 RepID=A0AAD8MM38_9APIA|nr:hypothetical protein POM88_033266 [Heracleum sosnowskyi]
MTVYPDDLYLPPSPSKTAIKNYCSDSCAYVLVLLCFAAVVGFPIAYLLVTFINRVGITYLYSEIPTMKIDSITVSNFNLSNPISAHWNINMTMHNTDSSFEFSDSTVSISPKSKEDALWMTRLNGFDMRPENTTFHFALDFGGLVHVNDTTARAIGDKITNNLGAVEFNVQFKADHPRGRRVSQLKQNDHGSAYKVNMLEICCDVLLFFGSPDKTQASMLTTSKHPACIVVHPSRYATGAC